MKLAGFLPLVAGSLVVAACSRDRSVSPAEALPAISVRVARVEASAEPRRQPVAGTVRPVDRAVVAAKVLATVARADLAVGQQVRAGDVLVTLTANEIAARAEQARAALSQAQRDHEREARLLEQGAATAESVRALADRARAAAAALDEAETLLGYTQVTAPFDGVITRDLVNPGDLATPGQPLLELEGTRQLRAEIQVPESLLVPALGSTLLVELDHAVINGSLAEVSPAADPVSRTRLAKVDLPDDRRVRSGQFVRVLWPAPAAQQLSVPENAVSFFGQMERLFVVENDRAHLRLVKTGSRIADRLVLLAGAEAGEWVILDPPASLRDGQAVEVAP